jgi:hypothetical protein
VAPEGLLSRLISDDKEERASAAVEAVRTCLANAPVGLTVTVSDDPELLVLTSATASAQLPVRLVRERWIEGSPLAGVIAQAMTGDSQESMAPSAEPLVPDASLVRTRQDQRIQEALHDAKSVLLVGRSSSGKTRSAQIAGSDWDAFGGTSCYLDLSSVGMTESVLLAALLLERPSLVDHLVVLDNLQSNPDLASALLARLAEWRLSASVSIKLLAVAWPTAAGVVRRAVPDVVEVACSGAEIASALVVSRLGENTTLAEGVMRLADGDALVADLVSRHIQMLRSANEPVPSMEDAARNAVAGLVPPSMSTAALDLLTRLAALGVLEVEVDRSFARSLSGLAALDELERSGLVRPAGAFLSVGHRSLAWLLLGHLEDRLSISVDPAAAGVEYLRAAEDSQIRAMLSRLDLVSLRTAGDHHGSQFLLQAWRSVTVLCRYVARQTAADPTWGDNTASQVFAAECLASMGDVASWEQIARLLRARWEVTGGSLPQPVGGPPKERVDFDEIYKTMKEEDDLGARLPWTLLTADDVDRDRMHQTWVLGLLLGFEGAAPVRDAGRVRLLQSAAESIQDPQGWFYPDRVPWVTARVVLGLAELGLTVESSNSVRLACDWLRSSPPDGPFDFGVWQAGTGRWNTDVMTTAMVMLALARAGVDPSDSCLQDAMAYLVSKRSEWSAPDKEIDTTLAIESMLASGRSWRELLDEIQLVLGWSRGQQPWSEATVVASESHTESSKVSLVASSLINVVWDTVRAELPLLLEGIVLAQKAKRRHDDRPGDPLQPIDWADALAELATMARYVERSLEERSVAIAGLSGSVPAEIDARTRQLEDIRRQLVDLDGQIRQRVPTAPEALHQLARAVGLGR